MGTLPKLPFVDARKRCRTCAIAAVPQRLPPSPVLVTISFGLSPAENRNPLRVAVFCLLFIKRVFSSSLLGPFTGALPYENVVGHFSADVVLFPSTSPSTFSETVSGLFQVPPTVPHCSCGTARASHGHFLISPYDILSHPFLFFYSTNL